MIDHIIQKNGYLLFDGAFGTYYASLYGHDMNCELANLRYPQRVVDIHKQYIEAGCNAIKTNTFGANPSRLECTKEEIKQIIQQGFQLVNEACEKCDCLVFADIGPCLEQKQAPIFEQLKETVDIFLDCGAKYFLFETFPNHQGLREIAHYIKNLCPSSYIITSFAVTADGYTQQGFSGKKLLQDMKECGDIDAWGYNCVCGPMHLHRLLLSLDDEEPLLIMPNAGYPTILHDHTYYRDNSDYFADEMRKIVHDGAKIIGGCCGTTPTFIHKVKQTLEKQEGIIKPVCEKIEAHKPKSHINNMIYERLEVGEKIIAVELDPPSNCDINKFMNNAECLREQGVDAITIADCPIARARVDSSLLAAKIHREMGMNVIPHMTCRDRNINATKALLYGLGIEGIHNVLVVTGDPIPSAERDEIKGVFNFNSQILASYIRDLNESVFPHPFLIYGALNVNAENFTQELHKAIRKEENGVSVFMTQPVLSRRALENLKRAKETLHAKILGGVIPIVSYQNAVYMNNEISGIDVDDTYIEMYKDKSREEAANIAVEVSCQIADEIYEWVDGYYLITPFNRVEIISAIISHIQSKEKNAEKGNII